MTSTPADRLAYRPNQAAEVLGTSRDTVFRLMARGELKSFRIGTGRYISAAELERIIREREAEANQ